MGAEQTFVILAAGRGSRLGRAGSYLHKVLVPLGGKAVLSHIIERANESGSRIVVCVGHRGDQIRSYLDLAHPSLEVRVVEVKDWDSPRGGPGWSLLAAKPHVTGNLTFTSCDTLWQWLPLNTSSSWAAIAPVPINTPPERWCRMAVDSDGYVTDILDKCEGPAEYAYTGLAHIAEVDLEVFWKALATQAAPGESQVTPGLRSVLGLMGRRIEWTDVGDEHAYAMAVAQYDGYDWAKPNQATYLLPNERRVVKFHADPLVTIRRVERAFNLAPHVPDPIIKNDRMMAYPFVHGMSGYEAADTYGIAFTNEVIKMVSTFTPVEASDDDKYVAATTFYVKKSYARVAELRDGLRQEAEAALARVPWNSLTDGVKPGHFHGDLNFGNILFAAGRIVCIDWREDFGGFEWGDLRYDYAKCIAGTHVHWMNAQRGDFRVWPAGAHHREAMMEAWPGLDVQIIGALSLLNSAPLHAAPLDEILVARAVAWLESIL